MAAYTSAIAQIQKRIWDGSIPLEIRLSAADCRTYDETDPYLVNVARLSYLPFLLPRLYNFFQTSLIDPSVSPTSAWLSVENVPLKWHYPLGLLYDLFSGAQPAHPDAEDLSDEQRELLPWKMTIHFSEYPLDRLIPLDTEGKVLLDAFINSVKEADVIRNGKGNVFMGLSKNDSDTLWDAVQNHDLPRFNTINNKLLNPPGLALRGIPLKLYLPTAKEASGEREAEGTPQGSIRTVQSLVAPVSSSRQPTTLGTALNTILPTVFPSRRNPVIATPVLHGAVIPMNAPVEELMRAAAYTDGFLHVAVILL